MPKKQASPAGGARPEKSEARTALDDLAAVFWRAAVAELEAELDQTTLKQKRKRDCARAEARI